MDESLEQALREMGLSKYETKIYVSLLMRGVATASELSDLSGVPYTRVYDVLNSLESKGLIASIPGRPLRYQALDPELAFRNMYELEKRALEEKLAELERNISRIVRLASRIKPGRGARSDKVLIVKGKTSIGNYILHMARTATGRILVVEPAGADEVLLKEVLREKASEDVDTMRKIWDDAPRGLKLPLLVVIDDKILAVEECGERFPDTCRDWAVIFENRVLADLLYAMFSGERLSEPGSHKRLKNRGRR